MSEENPEDKGKKTLKVEVGMNVALQKAIEENALLKQKIQEQEEIQSQIALETFERVKNESANAHPAYASSIRVCTTPEALEGTLARIQDEEKSEKERNYRAPSGKSGIGFTGQGGEQFESSTQMIDSLYDRAYYNPSKFTKEQVSDAKKKIEELLRSTIEGPSWSKLKEKGAIDMLKKHSYQACVKCNGTIIDDEFPCKNCGYNPTKKSKEGWIYKGPETREGAAQ